MRLVTWNCNMVFDRKYQALERLRPDIAVIPECANPDILRRKAPLFKPSDMHNGWAYPQTRASQYLLSTGSS